MVLWIRKKTKKKKKKKKKKRRKIMFNIEVLYPEIGMNPEV